MLVGYARISTTEQNLDLQHDALKAAGCERLVEDTAGGGKAHRSGLDRARDLLRPGDTLVVWRLDRLGRTLRHLIELRRIQENNWSSLQGGRPCQTTSQG